MTRSTHFGPMFENLVTLCRRNLYEATTTGLLEPSAILNSNGPCGALLRNNIRYEWMQNTVTSSSEIIFELANSLNGAGAPSAGNSHEKTALFSKNCLSNYPNVLQFLGNRLPFGLAQCGEVKLDPLPNSDAASYSLERLLPNQTLMLLQFYAPPLVANQWYSAWQRRRLSWWKKVSMHKILAIQKNKKFYSKHQNFWRFYDVKTAGKIVFSGNPSNFYLETLKSDNGQQTVDIHYKFPWGSSTIEQIRNYGNDPVQLLERETNQSCQGKDGRKSTYPCVIESITSVEAAVVAYLMDALKEKTAQDESIKHVLSLHNRLAPYKVSIASYGTSTQLKEIAVFLIKELKKYRISVLGLPDISSTTLEQQFIRYDEMGIPYCIVLNEATLRNGIVGLRNRDTTLREQLHVSQVSQVLLKYVSSF